VEPASFSTLSDSANFSVERSVQKKIKRIRNNFEGAKTSTTKVKTKSSKQIKQKLKSQVKS
jgi:hypothetical protein